MSHQHNFMGLNGFVWFLGVVENRDDPLKLGRVQARIFGWHTDDKSKIPTIDLPWAQPAFPPNASTVTSTPKEGDMVFGFFTDGESAQFPIFMGLASHKIIFSLAFTRKFSIKISLQQKEQDFLMQEFNKTWMALLRNPMHVDCIKMA